MNEKLYNLLKESGLSDSEIQNYFSEFTEHELLDRWFTELTLDSKIAVYELCMIAKKSVKE